MGLGQLLVKGLVSNIHIRSRFQCTHVRQDCFPDGNQKQPNVKAHLLVDIQPKMAPKNKVTIVGVGGLGVACAFTIISQNLTQNLCLIDSDEKRVQGEAMDFMHCARFKENLHIETSTDYAKSANSNVCIVTAGVRQKEGVSPNDLAQRNVDTIKNIIPPLVANSPNAVIIIATVPVDVVTYTAYKISGLPNGRVIGTGTNLDTSRFRYMLAEKLGIAPETCYGWIIGEQGDSSVAVWSGVNVAGVKLSDLKPTLGTPDDPEKLFELHQRVKSSTSEIIKLKGHVSWGAAASVASLTRSILKNSNTVSAVSFPIKGYYGIEEDICLSLPAVLGKNGLSDVLIQPLIEKEIEELHCSAKCVALIQKATN